MNACECMNESSEWPLCDSICGCEYARSFWSLNFDFENSSTHSHDVNLFHKLITSNDIEWIVNNLNWFREQSSPLQRENSFTKLVYAQKTTTTTMMMKMMMAFLIKGSSLYSKQFRLIKCNQIKLTILFARISIRIGLSAARDMVALTITNIPHIHSINQLSLCRTTATTNLQTTFVGCSVNKRKKVMLLLYTTHRSIGVSLGEMKIYIGG